MTSSKTIHNSSNVLYSKVSSCDDVGLKRNAGHNYYDIRSFIQSAQQSLNFRANTLLTSRGYILGTFQVY